MQVYIIDKNTKRELDASLCENKGCLIQSKTSQK